MSAREFRRAAESVMTSDSHSRKRPLTPEEAELWLHAMRQAKALRRREREHANAVAKAEGETAGGVAAEVAKPETVKPTRGPTKSVAPVRVAPAPALPKSPPPLAPFDERQRRKIARDADMIDARLDLHGMRQREAHGALVSFLRSCAARGMKNVLVITGKGVVLSDDGRERDFYREERGVLRRLVPEWLAGPELRGVVVSYAASHVRHGGEGALYVRLRKLTA